MGHAVRWAALRPRQPSWARNRPKALPSDFLSGHGIGTAIRLAANVGGECAYQWRSHGPPSAVHRTAT
jgi:hypothetical protein